MIENRIKTPLDGTYTSFKLNLPDDFISVCQFMNISFSQALQTYVDHIKVYNQLFNEKKGINVEATSIFKKFQKSCIRKHGMKTAIYPKLHVDPIREIIKLGMAKKGSDSTEYENIIKRWYQTIMKGKDENTY